MTVTQEEFDAHWDRLRACTITKPADELYTSKRYMETWKNFRLRTAGTFERTVDHYIETAGDEPWFPMPSQLIAVADRLAMEVALPTEPPLTEEDKARLRREMDEWLASPEVKKIERKILGKE